MEMILEKNQFKILTLLFTLTNVIKARQEMQCKMTYANCLN